MSTEYSPKATFKATADKNVLQAVNKRAKIVVRKAGKRTYIKRSDLKKFVGKGSYSFYLYTARKHKDGTPVLTPVRF